MPRRICQSIDDHEWVSDTRNGLTYCQACGLSVEDADEAHIMKELEELGGPGSWQGLVDYPDEGDD